MLEWRADDPPERSSSRRPERRRAYRCSAGNPARSRTGPGSPARQFAIGGQPVAEKSGALRLPEGRGGGQRQKQRQVGPIRFMMSTRMLRSGTSTWTCMPHRTAAAEHLQVVHHLAVARLRVGAHPRPDGERMGAGGHDRQVEVAGDGPDGGSQVGELRAHRRVPGRAWWRSRAAAPAFRAGCRPRPDPGRRRRILDLAFGDIPGLGASLTKYSSSMPNLKSQLISSCPSLFFRNDPCTCGSARGDCPDPFQWGRNGRRCYKTVKLLRLEADCLRRRRTTRSVPIAEHGLNDCQCSHSGCVGTQDLRSQRYANTSFVGGDKRFS